MRTRGFEEALYVTSVLNASGRTRGRHFESNKALRRYQAALAAYSPPPAQAAIACTICDVGSVQELLPHIDQLCIQLRDADPCALTGPQEATTAERALVMLAPHQAFKLQSCAEMCKCRDHCNATIVSRVVALLQYRLRQFSAWHGRAMTMQLEELPPLLVQLAPLKDPVLLRARTMPPQLAMALLTDPDVLNCLAERIGGETPPMDGGIAAKGATIAPSSVPSAQPRSMGSSVASDACAGSPAAHELLALLRAWVSEGLALLVQFPPRVHERDMAALPPVLRDALHSAGAAAVALCQATHYAGGSPGAPSLRQPPIARQKLESEVASLPMTAHVMPNLVAAAAWEHEAWREVGQQLQPPLLPQLQPLSRCTQAVTAGLAAAAHPYAKLLLRLARRLLEPRSLLDLHQAVVSSLEEYEVAEAAATEMACSNSAQGAGLVEADAAERPRNAGLAEFVNLQLALLVVSQAYLALIAQCLASALLARLRHAAQHADARQLLLPAELAALERAVATSQPALASVAALLGQPALLRRCASSAADGEARLLAARCEWACQLTCATELPPSDLGAALGLVGLRACLTAARSAQHQPVSVLAMRVQADTLIAMRTRPLPSPPAPTMLRAATDAAVGSDVGASGAGGGASSVGRRVGRKVINTLPCHAEPATYASASGGLHRAVPPRAARAPALGNDWRQHEARQASFMLEVFLGESLASRLEAHHRTGELGSEKPQASSQVRAQGWGP